MNRRRLLLSVLFFLLLLAVVSVWYRMPAQRRVGQLTYRPGAGTAMPMRSGEDNSGKHLLVLPQETTQQFPVQRNIFAPLGSFAGEKGKTVAHRPAAPVVPPAPPPSPHEIARRQLAGLRVLGSYSSKKAHLLFLASGEEILTVGVGYPLLPGYRISAVTDEILTLRSDDGGQQLQLPLQQ